MDLTIMLFPSPLLSCISLSAFETDAEDNEQDDGGREGAAKMGDANGAASAASPSGSPPQPISILQVEQKEVCTVYQPVVHPLYAPSQS